MITEEDLQKEIERLQLKKRALMRSADDIETEIIGLKELLLKQKESLKKY